MAVTGCWLDRETRKASVNEMNIGVYTLRYLVETNSTMGPKAVANGALTASPDALPAQWSTYSYQGDTDALSYARDYEIEGVPNKLNRWTITVTYRPAEPGEGGLDGLPVNAVTQPGDREPVFWWDREVTTTHATIDKDGKSIVNKCNDLYPDDIEIERPRGILVIEFNVESLGSVIQIQRKYDGAVNSQPWTIGGETVASRAALCREVACSPPMMEQGFTYFRITMRVAFADEGETWDYKLAERGQFHWSKGLEGEYETLVGPPGGPAVVRKVTNAQKIIALNEDGTRREDDEEFLLTAWRIRREVNFNDLGI